MRNILFYSILILGVLSCNTYIDKTTNLKFSRDRFNGDRIFQSGLYVHCAIVDGVTYKYNDCLLLCDDGTIIKPWGSVYDFFDDSKDTLWFKRPLIYYLMNNKNINSEIPQGVYKFENGMIIADLYVKMDNILPIYNSERWCFDIISKDTLVLKKCTNNKTGRSKNINRIYCIEKADSFPDPHITMKRKKWMWEKEEDYQNYMDITKEERRIFDWRIKK